jgi:hypothetical protein
MPDLRQSGTPLRASHSSRRSKAKYFTPIHVAQRVLLRHIGIGPQVPRDGASMSWL